MQIVNLRNVLQNFDYKWPKDIESFDSGIEYDAVTASGPCIVRIGYCYRQTYGKNRRRIVVWIEGYPYAEFIAADDFEISAQIPDGTPENVVRTVSENCDTLHFTSYGFEEE